MMLFCVLVNQAVMSQHCIEEALSLEWIVGGFPEDCGELFIAAQVGTLYRLGL